MHLGDTLTESDDGFKLTDSDWDTVGLLRDLLFFARLPICHIHVLEHVACLVTESREHIGLGVAQVLTQEV